MKSIQMICDRKYLMIPVAAGQPTKRLTITADGKKIYEFMVPDSEQEGTDSFSWYAPLEVGKYAGKTLSLEGEFGEEFYRAVCLADCLPKQNTPHPAVHFAADTGWLNDPNGFYCQDGIYHLYFQHNPMDTRWGNMSWGHAVSRDLVHWEQQETVMYPDEEGTIFSGCGILNERGLLNLPKDVPVFFYTAAGHTSQWSEEKQCVQKIACSLDGGRTLLKTGITAVPHMAGDNRDPKVYWHEESGGYYMVLYLEGNEFAILRSEDLEHWTVTQRLTLENCWECPDLVRMPVEGGGSRWVFWCGDGFYFIGDFDGYTFTCSGENGRAYASGMAYAAQTCWGEERVISIPWLRTGNPDALYTGVMGIPRELSLTERNGSLKLRQRPVRELQGCRKRLDAYEHAEGVVRYRYEARGAAELVIFPEENAGFQAVFGKAAVQYDSESRELRISGCLPQEGEENRRSGEPTLCSEEGCIKKISLEEHPGKVELLVDHEILEVTLDDGLVCAQFEIVWENGASQAEALVETTGRAEFYEVC